MNIQGDLSDKEWRELLGLEYVLTWNPGHDEARYKYLSNRRWVSLGRE